MDIVTYVFGFEFREALLIAILLVVIMKWADTFVTFLEGVFKRHFLDIEVVDFGRV